MSPFSFIARWQMTLDKVSHSAVLLIGGVRSKGPSAPPNLTSATIPSRLIFNRPQPVRKLTGGQRIDTATILNELQCGTSGRVIPKPQPLHALLKLGRHSRHALEKAARVPVGRFTKQARFGLLQQILKMSFRDSLLELPFLKVEKMDHLSVSVNARLKIHCSC